MNITQEVLFEDAKMCANPNACCVFFLRSVEFRAAERKDYKMAIYYRDFANQLINNIGKFKRVIL